MALGSSIADALPPTIEKLRQQMAGLSSKAAGAVPSASSIARPALLQQALDNAPLLMELGTALLRRLRGMRDDVADRLSPVPMPVPQRRRSRFLRPVVIGLAVFGVAYALSVATKPGTAGRKAARRM